MPRAQLVQGRNTHPRYVALSYAWGDFSQPGPVLIDECTLPLSEIGGAAAPSTGIWIDALCINQADTAEKNAQVRLMSRIYSEATCVFIWLGPDRDGSGVAALRMLSQLGVFFRELRAAPSFDNAKIAAFVKTVLQFAEPRPHGAGGTFDFDLIWRLLRQRPWWWRVWVIQEMVLARTAMVFCGYYSVPWEDIIDGLRVFEWMALYPSTEPRHRRVYSVVADISQNLLHLVSIYNGYRTSLQGDSARGMPLLEIILGAAHSAGNGLQATDSRDKIYGLLGMVRQQDRDKIEVDYSEDMPLSKVLFMVAKALVEEYGPNILIYCQETKLAPALPSWAPDWTSPRTPVVGDVFGRFYEAAGGKEWSARSLSLTYEEPLLSLGGHLCSTVRTVGLEFGATPDPSRDSNSYRDFIIDLQSMISLSGSEAESNLWRVPIADFGLVDRADREGAARFTYGYDVLSGVIKPPADMSTEEKSAWALSESWDYRRVWKLKGRRAFVDDAGRPGMGPQSTLAGDQIALFAGGGVPFAVRRGQDGLYRLVGPVYVVGLMDGEAAEEARFREIPII
ncbi:hypothetical protein GQ53DRAFT_813423 [Thozetella sp. PMI_491]|nr:hypothetical protein GQ53DRAFT_813423 [Thozetella sp. PMI_491]